VHQQRDRLIQRIQRGRLCAHHRGGGLHLVQPLCRAALHGDPRLSGPRPPRALEPPPPAACRKSSPTPPTSPPAALPGLNAAHIADLKLAGNKDGELYRLLLVAQCNALSAAMPFLFERIDDESELLLPDNLLRTDSIHRFAGR
jgi:hypothetical protein